MAKKSYTQNLTEINVKLGKLETIAGYQENHMSNMDGHLNRLNERTAANEVGNTRVEGKADSNRSLILKVLLPTCIGVILTVITVGLQLTIGIF